MKLNLALIALSGTLLSTNALANLVTITWADNHSPSGGEFVLTPDTGAPFNSFCLERNEFISLGGTYSYTVNNSAVAGGLAGGSPDPISIGTAYLYSQFRAGTLTGYTSASSANQTALQEAFWWLEDEIPTGDYPFDPTLNPYLTLANDALAGDLDALKADANGAYAVDDFGLGERRNEDSPRNTYRLRSRAIPRMAVIERCTDHLRSADADRATS